MKNKFKFVVVGSGNISKTYFKAVEEIQNAEIVGLVSRSLNKPKFVDENKIEIFRSIKEIKIDFDAVILCTPNGLHHIGAIEAASLGKHVLTEKVLDISIQNMDEMIKICDENSVKLAVAYQRRLSADNPKIRELLSENKLGNVFSVNLSVKNYRDNNYYNSADYRGKYKIDGGGPFMQQASHSIDLYYWFFGRPSKVVSKLGTFVHDIETEDHGSAICLHEDGMIGTITASTATKPGFPPKLQVYSDKGYFEMENDLITKWEIDEIENPSLVSDGNMHTGAATHTVEDVTNHKRIIIDFIDSVNNNTEPIANGKSARVATEIILDIYNNQFS